MRGFFVSHPLKRAGDVPGRYPLDADVIAIDTTSKTTICSTLSIIGDAYGHNRLGPNMDPCIFSEPLPWTWSYCRMDNHGRPGGHNHIVDATRDVPVPTSLMLNEEITVGDVVFFGGVNGERVWIDTVFVVGAKEPWQLKHIRKNKKQLLVPPIGVSSKTDAWRFHFQDHRVNHQYISWSAAHYFSFYAVMWNDHETTALYSFIPYVGTALFYLSGNDGPDLTLRDLLFEARDAVKKLSPT